ncbi:hypothetical protein GDO81_011335 [Engystomops pustulosus]|uniref:Mitochondrial ribosomal protein S36 n=1 Tax=Engystomops pustulosus TaxID=76066 RepID=A0AAV7BDI9_ENGPU|nr:hypothetical protein GDO81_011335 [Engystomops pustulosus]
MGSGALWALRGQSSLTVTPPHSRQPSSVYKQITSLQSKKKSILLSPKLSYDPDTKPEKEIIDLTPKMTHFPNPPKTKQTIKIIQKYFGRSRIHNYCDEMK